MAKIFLKGGTEHTLINAVREAYYQPFQATNWTDLRVGFFVSVCGAADPAQDDVITGLAEEIGTPPQPMLPSSDRFTLGLIDSATGTVFCGYANYAGGRQPLNIGTSKLVSSDAAIGTTNTFFWRVINEVGGTVDALKIIDGSVIRASGADGSQLHLVQDTVGAGGYCTLVALRFQRDDPHNRANVISMSAKLTGTHNGDILYTSTPTDVLLESNLESFPANVQTLGPFDLSHVPDTLWCYWPFHGSRIRVHAYGVLKVA